MNASRDLTSDYFPRRNVLVAIFGPHLGRRPPIKPSHRGVGIIIIREVLLQAMLGGAPGLQRLHGVGVEGPVGVAEDGIRIDTARHELVPGAVTKVARMVRVSGAQWIRMIKMDPPVPDGSISSSDARL